MFDGDGDGIVDVFVGSQGLYVTAVVDGNVTLQHAGALTTYAPTDTIAAAVGDLSGDFILDMVLLRSGGSVVIVTGSVFGVFSWVYCPSLEPLSAALGQPKGVALADVNQDGVLDVLVYGTGSSWLALNARDATMTFTVTPMLLQWSINAAAFADVDFDGFPDVVVIRAAMNGGTVAAIVRNDGNGGFSATADEDVLFQSVAVAGTTFGPLTLVDVNADGVLDAPGIGYVGEAPVLGVAALYVRLLGRNGRLNQHGASVCVVTLGCSVVPSGGGGPGVGQAPYDVYVALPNASASHQLSVAFTSGRRIDWQQCWQCANVTAPVLGASLSPVPVVVIRDIPGVWSVSLDPSVGALTAGSTVTITLYAAWGEAGLVPSTTSACCTFNGVDVADSFIDLGYGAYQFTYTVDASDRNIEQSVPSMALQLCDARYPDACVDVTAFDHFVLPQSNVSLTIDTVAPFVTLTCTNWNNTLRTTNTETVCLSCGNATFEAALGCVIWQVCLCHWQWCVRWGNHWHILVYVCLLMSCHTHRCPVTL